MTASIDFIGPLDRASQSWCDEVIEADCVAALSEHPELVARRREASIAGYQHTVTKLLLLGDIDAARTIAFGAVAESRALAEFEAATRSHSLDAEWHRFGG
ncbi:MAG: hypothetical protein M3Y42_00130 [Actinomycetota bacterium]|nr:hypothetical protein [Actinomycetota bacterium]MDQ2955361.1 hypothetical protein [Actinomycetota bacterium]